MSFRIVLHGLVAAAACAHGCTASRGRRRRRRLHRRGRAGVLGTLAVQQARRPRGGAAHLRPPAGFQLPARGEPAGTDRAQLLRLPGRDARRRDGRQQPRRRSAQYQAFIGDPATGALSDYERTFLTSSYDRAIVGGAATAQTIATSGQGTRGLLLAYRQEQLGVPATPAVAVAPPPLQPAAPAAPAAPAIAGRRHPGLGQRGGTRRPGGRGTARRCQRSSRAGRPVDVGGLQPHQHRDQPERWPGGLQGRRRRSTPSRRSTSSSASPAPRDRRRRQPRRHRARSSPTSRSRSSARPSPRACARYVGQLVSAKPAELTEALQQVRGRHRHPGRAAQRQRAHLPRRRLFDRRRRRRAGLGARPGRARRGRLRRARRLPPDARLRHARARRDRASTGSTRRPTRSKTARRRSSPPTRQPARPARGDQRAADGRRHRRRRW